MSKLRTLLMAAFVTLSMASLNLGAAESVIPPGGIEPVSQTGGWCWVFFLGRWWEIPC